MTTRRSARTAPVLDRLISVNITTTIPALASYRYRSGKWAVPEAERLEVDDTDSDGQGFPRALTLPVTAFITIGGSRVEYQVTAQAEVRDGFNQRTGSRLTIPTLPDQAAAGEMVIEVQTGTSERVEIQREWAARRELRVSDQVKLTDTALFRLTDVYFIVRTTPGVSYEVGATLTDDRGVTRSIIGVGYEEYGRGRFTSLLARAPA